MNPALKPKVTREHDNVIYEALREIRALATRVQGLEGRMETVELDVRGVRDDLRENTTVSTRTHMLLEGTDEHKGMRDKVAEMYGVVETAQSGLKIIGALGDFIEKNGKRLFWIGLLFAAVITYLKTGHLPPWFVTILAP
jgi:predicted phage tail protein